MEQLRQGDRQGLELSEFYNPKIQDKVQWSSMRWKQKK